MSDSNQAILQRAFELIEREELDQAQDLLAPLLENDADNATLWWVYAHAVRDTAIGQAALERVLELDPAYPGARELKTDVLGLQPPENDFAALDVDEPHDTGSASNISIDDWENLQQVPPAEGEATRSRTGLVLLVLVLLIAGTGAALLLTDTIDISELLSRFLPTAEAEVIVVSAPTDAPTPADIAPEETQVATEMVATTETTDEGDAGSVAIISTAEATAQATAETGTTDATPEATLAATVEDTSAAPGVSGSVMDFVESVATDISDFTVDPELSTTQSTGLGSTLVIQVCAIPGPEFNERLTSLMNAVVGLAEDIPAGIEAIAAGLLNCDDSNATLRVIGVTVAVINEFAEEEISQREFQRAWQPLS